MMIIKRKPNETDEELIARCIFYKYTGKPLDDAPEPKQWNPQINWVTTNPSFELAKSLAEVSDDPSSRANEKFANDVRGDTDSHKAPDYYTDDEGHDLFWHFKNGLLTAEQYKGFLLGNIYKYLSRHGKKDGELSQKDLNKALNYLNELISFESGDYNG